MKILAVSPIFNNTEVALFKNYDLLWRETQRYDLVELEEFSTILSQEDFRVGKLKQLLVDKGVDISEINAFVSTGGMLHPVEGGTYKINIKMLQDLISCRYGERVINLGAPIAARLASIAGSRYAYVVDPPVVDEMSEVAHMTGLPEISKRSTFHALNQKAVAHREAERLGKALTECNFIVCHLGDSVSIGAHQEGRVIDVGDIFGGSGPISLDRAGNLPSIALVDLCFSGKYTAEELKTRVMGVGGLVAHLGTSDTGEIIKRVRSGDRKARITFEAFVRNLLINIGGCAALMKGKIDTVILTGRMTENEFLCQQITGEICWIAPVMVYPGEDDMQSLVDGVMRVMKGLEEVKIYA